MCVCVVVVVVVVVCLSVCLSVCRGVCLARGLALCVCVQGALLVKPPGVCCTKYFVFLSVFVLCVPRGMRGQ